METGRILRGIGGFYYVRLSDGRVVTSRARGRFRRERITPMIGDLVDVEPQQDGDWALQTIHARKNALVRPPVSNIDRLVIVVAASNPKPDWLLVDKLLLQGALLSISPVLVLNKLDEREQSVMDTFHTDYATAFPVCRISTKTGEGLPALRTLLDHGVSCLAGQSAVGKSSLINALIPALSLEVGALSEKTERGRHTTRHAELLSYGDGMLVDTPGFSLLETGAMTQERIDACYPEFGDAPTRCRFAGCTHIAEPDCAVKALVASGKLSAGRYARYLTLHKEIEQRRMRIYD